MKTLFVALLIAAPLLAPRVASATEDCIARRDGAKATLSIRPRDSTAHRTYDESRQQCLQIAQQRLQEARAHVAKEEFSEAKGAAKEAVDLFGDEADPATVSGRRAAENILADERVSAAKDPPPAAPGAKRVPLKASSSGSGAVSADECQKVWTAPRRNPDTVVECEKMASEAIKEGKVYLMADDFANAEKSANRALQLAGDPSLRENKSAKDLLAEIRRRK